jgi:HK97 family phage portal protein
MQEQAMGWWFGRKSLPPAGRAFAPGMLAALGDDSNGFARGYAAMADEVFRKNPVGQRSVRLIAGAVGGLPIYAMHDGGEGAVALVQSDGLLEGIAANLLLHGNAYVRVALDSRGKPAELLSLRPERVSVTTDAKGWPAGFVYRAGEGVTRIARSDPLGRTQMVHIKALNPGDDHYGLGCLDAAIAAASVHNKASLWNKALLANAARPSGALTYAPGDGAGLSGEQFERLKDELDTQFSGAANAGRPLLLDGGLSWQAMSLTPAEMDFAALKEGAARDIALAFGVPPVLVGLPGDATYANAREAGRALYRQTVLPLAGKILAALGAMLDQYGAPAGLAIDTDQLTERAEDRALLWSRVGAADFISRDEKRDMLGFAGDGQ